MAHALTTAADLSPRAIGRSMRRLFGAGLTALLLHNPCSAQLSRQEVDRLFQANEAPHLIITAGNWTA